MCSSSVAPGLLLDVIRAAPSATRDPQQGSGSRTGDDLVAGPGATPISGPGSFSLTQGSRQTILSRAAEGRGAEPSAQTATRARGRRVQAGGRVEGIAQFQLPKQPALRAGLQAEQTQIGAVI